MTHCEAISCYKEKEANSFFKGIDPNFDSFWGLSSESFLYRSCCPYHKRCLSKLRECYSNIKDIQEIETFTTLFNGNCGYVINYDYSASSSYPYYIWVVVYEPAVRSMNEKLATIKYDNYSSLEYAKDKARELKIKLQNSNGWYDYPMLEVHPKANSYEYFSNIITSPYVGRCEVGSANVNNYVFFVNGSGSTPSNLDNYFKPLDIIKIREAHMIVEGITSAVTYYHVGIYLGDVGNGNRICHFSRERNGVRLASWEGFLSNRIGELYRYHPIIPFKNPRRIAEQIAWAYSNNFREDQYNFRNRNCEHFANMCIYGINYSEQMEDNKERLTTTVGIVGGVAVGTYAVSGVVGVASSLAFAAPTFGLSLLWGAASAVGAGVGSVGAVAASYDLSEVNNGKGSTIKLVNEMSESNGKLGERDNWLSDRIKANIEVPPKEHCRIM